MKENIIIFGDSYSTFEGFIPEGYATYYSNNDRNGSGVIDVSQTWWNMVVNEADLNLVLNNSWSGSTIGYTGYNNSNCANSSSFIFRLKQLISKGFFKENKIDKAFVFGGTNDSWSNAPLGEEKYSDWNNEEFYNVLPAVCYFLSFLKETLPEADIYCLINTDIKDEISNCLKTASKKFGVNFVTFDNIDKVNGHPTVKGMEDIKNSVLKAMNII